MPKVSGDEVQEALDEEPSPYGSLAEFCPACGDLLSLDGLCEDCPGQEEDEE